MRGIVVFSSLIIILGVGLLVYFAVATATDAADEFGRTVTDGWGNARIGGTYIITGQPANFGVDGAAGTIRSSANVRQSAYLPSVSVLNVDFAVRAKTDQQASAGGQAVYVVARRVNPGSDYLGRLRCAMDGSVRLQAVAEVAGSATLLGNEVVVAGLSHTANRYVWLRMEASGTNPTTLRLKAWADDQPEPATWLYTVSDSTSALQAPGAVGLRTFSAGASDNAPVVFTFDDLRVTSMSEGSAFTGGAHE